jgi:hypothetical protein
MPTKSVFVEASYIIRVYEGFDPRNLSVECEEKGKRTIFRKVLKSL